MGIYIKGMEMPTARDTLVLVKTNGTAIVYEDEAYVTAAVPVPARGRLIDADALINGVEADAIWEDNTINEYDKGIMAGAKVMMRSIRNAPTIIPAEEGE